jgi:Putative Ig domain
VLTVTAPPAIITSTSATATVGSGFSFTVRAKEFPAPTLTETGAIPQGLTWTDNGDGTATLAGAPGVAQGGVYKLTFTAASGYGTAAQSFTLTVAQAPGMLSAPAATAVHGKPFSFTFAAAGYPVPAIGHSGSVPGLKFGTSSNGTLTLSGTPTTAGTYGLTITAKNSIGTVTQAFTLTVS